MFSKKFLFTAEFFLSHFHSAFFMPFISFLTKISEILSAPEIPLYAWKKKLKEIFILLLNMKIYPLLMLHKVIKCVFNKASFRENINLFIVVSCLKCHLQEFFFSQYSFLLLYLDKMQCFVYY